MPYIVITSTCPSHVVPETTKRIREVQEKYPPDDNLFTAIAMMTRRVPEGVKAINISEPKPGKLEEALARAERIIRMYVDIEGFESTIEVYYSLEEAMEFTSGS